MLKETWHNAGVASRSGLIGGAVVILAFTLAAAWWLLHSRNGVLFTDLEPGDAAAVVTELERMKVDYKLAADGTHILVPLDEVHEIRLKLLGSGLPLHGGVGFELFDKAEFGMTEFAQRINFQRAMQGELTRTITSLKEVKNARVHLVLPEASLFQKDKTSPSASITLFLKSGSRIDEQQIAGIQQLVSASVPGLEAAAVTIVDQYGKTLSALIEEEGGIVAVTSRLQKKKEVEAYLTEKTVRVLERTFGPGKAIVSIDVSLNFDQSKTTREEVIPGTDENGGMVHKRESRSEPTKGHDKQSGRGEVNTEVEYRLGRSVEQIVSTPGGIERLSVGVLVPVNTRDEQLRQIEDLVAMAVGLDIARGDAIAVHSAAAEIVPEHLEETNGGNTTALAATEEIQIPIEPVPAPEIELGWIKAWLYGYWMKYPEIIVLGGIAIVLFLMIVVGLERKARQSRRINETRQLNDERERILSQLKAWINADEVAPSSKGETS